MYIFPPVTSALLSFCQVPLLYLCGIVHVYVPTVAFGVIMRMYIPLNVANICPT